MPLQKTLLASCFIITSLPIAVFAQDNCVRRGHFNICQFTSMHSPEIQRQYFHCDIDGSIINKFNASSKYLNITGSKYPVPLTPLLLRGNKIKDILDRYYFEVKRGQLNPHRTIVAISSDAYVTCHPGKGNRQALYVG